jgi:hypothetical protein
MFHYEEVVCFVAENGVLATQRVDAMSLQWLSERQTWYTRQLIEPEINGLQSQFQLLKRSVCISSSPLVM